MHPSFDITAFLKAALAEDIGSGDITSEALIPADAQGAFAMNARVDMVAAGLKFLPELFSLLDPAVQVELKVKDGTRVPPGTMLAKITGPARAILTGERVALNLVQQLSGVALLTREYVDAVIGTGAKIYDTRKTVPGMRYLQKYAVVCGGGHNHRMGLYDMVLIKDNHIAVAGSIAAAVAAARAYPLPLRGRAGVGPSVGTASPNNGPHLTSPLKGEESQARGVTGEKILIQVECDTLAQVNEAIDAKADLILLDNMSNTALREGASRCKAAGIVSEASGNVSLQTVRAIAETGVERISIGKLTHSAVAVDIGLDAV